MAKQSSTIKLLSNYASRAYEGEISQTVANTAAYHAINTGYKLSDGYALLVHRCNFYAGVAIFQDLIVAGDEFQVGLFTGTDSNDFNTTDNQKYFPNNGILVAPQPLYFGFQTFGAGVAYTVAAELWYTPVSIPSGQALEFIMPFIPQDV